MPTTSSITAASFLAATDILRERILAQADEWAATVEARMQSEARWHDRNGPSVTDKNARESLEAEAAEEDNGNITIVARSTRQTLTPWRGWDGAPLGAFLEKGTRNPDGSTRMAARPVIWPILVSSAPDLRRRVQKVMNGE